ncbi:hypothetical protein PAXINDRAFT_11558 [Paxillus involutus ATCC 200175]|uniref:DEAD/DEAH-box helicase domain-containing protein n=1 Tax=Paxillus involutus ATCC 200175 TaxID=664439 RepID=A0A0C9TZV7_PAXIN|nr:hypothetical protein PAXINDRAFT_11558 [Paxillus involutus ATCC 200175]
MSENEPPLIWPPVRHQSSPHLATPVRENGRSLILSRLDATFPSLPDSPHTPNHLPRTPLSNTQNTKQRRYRNGYELKPQTPSYKPYALQRKGRKRQHAFAFEDSESLQPHHGLTLEQWNHLAHQASVLPETDQLRSFQVECANAVLSRERDVCVIAPTGQGKSLLWVLPLLVQRTGCSLIITPYTNLGLEGQER